MTLCDASVGQEALVSFASERTWQWLLQFCIIAIGLLAGNILRRKVPFLRKSLIPSALLGGALLLCLKAIPGMRENIVDKQAMEIITYHALGLGFVALALKNNKIESKSSTMTVIETGTLTASTYLIHADATDACSLHRRDRGGGQPYARGAVCTGTYASARHDCRNYPCCRWCDNICYRFIVQFERSTVGCKNGEYHQQCQCQQWLQW